MLSVFCTNNSFDFYNFYFLMSTELPGSMLIWWENIHYHWFFVTTPLASVSIRCNKLGLLMPQTSQIPQTSQLTTNVTTPLPQMSQWPQTSQHLYHNCHTDHNCHQFTTNVTMNNNVTTTAQPQKLCHDYQNKHNYHINEVSQFCQASF